MVVVPAAMETTKTALVFAVFHVLNNSAILERLKAELHAAWPEIDNVPSLQDLERLPFLTAVIQEGKILARKIGYGPSVS